MPKKVWKIDQFHGGLNDNANPKDIADNEFAELKEVMIDKPGVIRMIGGTAVHGEIPTNVGKPFPSANCGHGLFLFNHDRLGGAVSDLEHLTDGSDATDVNWDAAGGGSFSNNLTHTHATSSASTFQQLANMRAIRGAEDVTYKFEYTVAYTSGSDSDVNVFRISGGAGQFANAHTNLTQTAGTHETTFLSRYNATDNPFQIEISTTGTAIVTIDNMSLKVDSVPQTGDSYLIAADSGDSSIDVYSKNDEKWTNDIIDLGAGSNMLPVFYSVDGALRICDGSFDSQNPSQWYGYIERDHFKNISGTVLSPGGVQGDYKKWHSTTAAISPPTRGLVGTMVGQAINNASNTATNLTDTDFFPATWEDELDSGGYQALNSTEDISANISAWVDASNIQTSEVNDWNEDYFVIYPDAGTGFNLQIATTGSGRSIPAGTYEFGTTFLYDGTADDINTQESSIYICAGTIALSAGEWFTIRPFATAPFDPRITGGRVYARISGSSDSWQHFAEIDLTEGIRASNVNTYNNGRWAQWDTANDDTSKHVNTLVTALAISSLGPATYESNTGRSVGITNLTANYKTAIVANRRVYVGNVEIDGISYPDMMLKSPVNQFDIFTKDKAIEVTINDGDEIIKLEEYADRILQFKKTKMHLINISQEVEFLEDTFIYKGVTHPSAVCKTDFGIAWVNIHGVYLYDGQKVNNLFEKKGRRVINANEWKSWLYTTGTIIVEEPMIGYLPDQRQLIIRRDDSSGGSDGNIYLFDLVTSSWTKADDQIPEDDSTSQVTNFITDWHGDLIFGSNASYGSTTMTYRKWVDLASESTTNYDSNVSIKTKEIDFGFPAVRKKIYKVYVTYKGGVIGPAPEITKVQCIADDTAGGTSLDGKYFDIDTHGGQKTQIWFDTNASGSAPAGTGSYNDTIKVTQVGANDSAESVAIALASAINEDAGAHSTAKVEGDTVIITDAANQAVTSATMSAGDTGFTVTQAQAGASSTTAQNIDVTYATNGSSTFNQFDGNLTDSTGNQIEAELKPSSTINNIKSIQLKFDGTASNTFEINDISIIYRLKNVK